MDKNVLNRMTKTDLIARIEELEAGRAKGDIYRLLLDESSDPIFMFEPDGTYRYVNIAFARGVGKQQDEIIGRKISDIFPLEEAEKRFAVMRWVFENGQTRSFDVRVPRADGDLYFLTTVKPVFDGQGAVNSVICISKEITGRKHMEEELVHLSTHDALTHLYNRYYFHTELERIADGPIYPVCIVMTDLDNLKAVNDNQGHKVGDAYIQRAAELLKSCFRADDIIARIGGDEFVVLLRKTDQDSLMDILARLKTAMYSQNGAFFSMSIGWAIGGQGCDLQDLMHQADVRMYREKVRRRR